MSGAITCAKDGDSCDVCGQPAVHVENGARPRLVKPWPFRWCETHTPDTHSCNGGPMLRLHIEDKLRSAAESAGGMPRFARIVGASPAHLNMLRAGSRQQPGLDLALRLEHAAGILLPWWVKDSFIPWRSSFDKLHKGLL